MAAPPADIRVRPRRPPSSQPIQPAPQLALSGVRCRCAQACSSTFRHLGRVLPATSGYYAPYLSAFCSPLIKVGPIPPGVWGTAWAPLVFRLTCYYYRKAYFRSFSAIRARARQRSATGRRYLGETAFPWVFNNFHRFAFYATVVQVAFLWFDAVVAFDFGGRFGIGLGSVLMLTNVLLLSGYTFGCHAFRHLAGGELDCFSRARSRHAGATSLLLEGRHRAQRQARPLEAAGRAFVSVAGTDIYIRLLLAGALRDPRWIA